MNLYESVKRNINESATKVYDYDELSDIAYTDEDANVVVEDFEYMACMNDLLDLINKKNLTKDEEVINFLLSDEVEKLRKKLKKNLKESETNPVTTEEVRGDIFNCLEMYSEDQWNGSDDDYAQEVLEQNLYDAILSVVEKHLGLTFEDIVKIPRESDPSTIIYNQFLDYVYAPGGQPDANEAIKVFVGMCNDVFKEYKAKNGLKEAESQDALAFSGEICDYANGLDYHIVRHVDDIEDRLKSAPIGTHFYQPYIESHSFATSHGLHTNENKIYIEYELMEDGWRKRHYSSDLGKLVSAHDVAMGICHNSASIYPTMEEAKNGSRDVQPHSHVQEYAPKSTIDPDNPHWDGNFYGI